MVDDPVSGRRRAQEDEYFQKKDRELIEQIRQRAKVQQELRELVDEPRIGEAPAARPGA